MAQYFDFQPNSLTAFSFPALLDGVQYNAVVTWNIFGLRWYLNLYSTQGTLVYSTPVVESPDGFDVSLLPKSFTSVLVFRDSTKQFEIWDTPNTYPDFNSVPDWMLDSTLGKFVLDSSSLLASDVMFDAAGNPIVLNQSTLQSEAMLDAQGGQFVLGPSSQANPGMVSVAFANAPLMGAILTAVDSLNKVYALGTGDGVTQQFHTMPNVQLNLPARIYKQDWQGNQLQYSTPRTNVALYSQQIGSAPWAVLNATPTLNAGASPDGTITASLLVEDATSNYHRVFQAQSTYARNMSVPIALFVKRASGTRNVGLQLTDSGANYGWIDYDLTAVTATPRISGGAAISNAGIVALSNGWFFCFAGVTVNSASGTIGSSLFAYMETGTTPLYVGDGASGLYLWGAMIGTNGGYIPTTAAPVTVTDYTETDGGSILAATQDLSSQAMLTGQGTTVTLDQSIIP